MSNPNETPMTWDEMKGHAKRAVERVDLYGRRGAMQVTTEEITALCLMTVLAGQVPADGQIASQAIEIAKGNQS